MVGAPSMTYAGNNRLLPYKTIRNRAVQSKMACAPQSAA